MTKRKIKNKFELDLIKSKWEKQTLEDLKSSVDFLIEECGSKAEISCRLQYSYDPEPDIIFEIEHEREETDKEYQARLKKNAAEKLRAQKLSKQKEQQELKEYERLKKKFEKGKIKNK